MLDWPNRANAETDMIKTPSDALRRMAAAVRRARLAEARRPPKLVFDAAKDSVRILYLSPSPPAPRGGVRVIYRHVDLLNEAGFDAAVLHDRRGYRASWFENSTRLANDNSVGPADLLIVPEYYGSRLREFSASLRITIFNQGPYYTFADMSPADAARYAQQPKFGMLTVSEDALALLQATFPGSEVHHVRPVIDAAVFHPAAEPPAIRQIAYAANRRALERDYLLAMLRARGRLEGWALKPIGGMSEAEVADTLRRSAIFLSFSELDGFGLPPAEAMACGCYVIGFHGQGGREFFSPDYCQPIPDSDLVAFAGAVEAAVAEFDRDPDSLIAAGRRASAAVLGRYSEAGLRDDLVRFYASVGISPAAR